MATVLYTSPGAGSSTTCNVGAGGLAGTTGAGNTVVNTGAITGSVTVPSSQLGSINTWVTSNSITGNGNLTGEGLHVTSDAEFEGNIKWKGRDLGKMLETIEKRLAILEPNPKKLKKFEALQKAYDHYKLLEALCHSDEDEK